MTTKQIQTWLSKHGYKPGPIDGRQGPKTTAAIKAFQRDHHLVVDGIAGSRTQAAMRRRSSPVRRVVRAVVRKPAPCQKMLKIAASQIGVHESPAGSNRQKFGVWFGLNGAKWCAIFLCWCAAKAGVPLIHTASTREMAAWFKVEGRWGKTPRIGAIVFFDFGTDHIHHVGVVERIEGSAVRTIEGNTSITSDDNGGEVMRRVRKSGIAGYGYPKYR